MSIATQLQAYQNGLTDAYNMVSQRGGSMPVHKNMSSLASSIATIPSGSSFTGIPKEVNSSGVYGAPTTPFEFALPSTATDLPAYTLYGAFSGADSGITKLDLSSLSSASTYCCYQVCYDAKNLTTVDLSSLVTAGANYAFYQAFCSSATDTALTTVDLSSLTTVSAVGVFYEAFRGRKGLTAVDLSSLTSLTGNDAMQGIFRVTGLTSMSFSSLSNVAASAVLREAFTNCTDLTSVSFPALTTSSFGSRTNQFFRMLNGCTGVTVHFPAAIQSTIGSWSDVTNGFNGTNTTVLFDL